MKEVIVHISDSMHKAAEAWGRGQGLSLDQVIARVLSEFSELNAPAISGQDLKRASFATRVDSLRILAELERMQE